jgi:hypothetical protein
MTCYCAAMRGVLLNEWRRIGIVLSVAWGIGVSIFTWQSAEVLINDTQSYYYNCIFRLGEEGHCGEQLRVLEAATWHVAREQTLWGLLPIPVIWLLLWIFVVSARWFTRRFHINGSRDERG